MGQEQRVAHVRESSFPVVIPRCGQHCNRLGNLPVATECQIDFSVINKVVLDEINLPHITETCMETEGDFSLRNVPTGVSDMASPESLRQGWGGGFCHPGDSSGYQGHTP